MVRSIDLSAVFETTREGRTVNVVDALFDISDSLREVAGALRDLGNGNATTEMGAIENLALQVQEGLELISSSISSHNGLEEIADAIHSVPERLKHQPQ